MARFIDLDRVIGKLEGDAGRLTLVTPSSAGKLEGSTIIYGERYLVALRDALIEAYPINEQEYKGELCLGITREK